MIWPIAFYLQSFRVNLYQGGISTQQILAVICFFMLITAERSGHLLHNAYRFKSCSFIEMGLFKSQLTERIPPQCMSVNLRILSSVLASRIWPSNLLSKKNYVVAGATPAKAA